MIDFPVHTEDTAPEDARPTLAAMRERYRMLPNMFAMMAESPEALRAYDALSKLWAETALSDLERQIVLLAINHENGCRYCMASQSRVSKHAGMAPEMLEALRAGAPLSDPKLETLRSFAVAVVRSRGWVGDGAIEALLAAGYPKRTVYDVVLAAAFKTLSNYSDHLVEPSIDRPFEKYLWQSAPKEAAE